MAKEDELSGPRKSSASPEIEQMKHWIRDRVGSWENKSPKYVTEILKVVAVADPNIIHLVRVSESGKGRDMGKLTPSRLWAIVDVFPGEEYYPHQNVITDIVLQFDLSAADTSSLSYRLKASLQKGTTLKLNDLATIIAADILFEKKQTSKRVLSVNNGSVDKEIVMETGSKHEVSEVVRRSRIERGRSGSGSMGTVTQKLSEHGTVENEQEKFLPWWDEVEYLTVREKSILKGLFVEGRSVTSVQAEHGITSQDVLRAIINTLKERQRELADSQKHD